MSIETLQVMNGDDRLAEQLAYCEKMMAEWKPLLPDEPQDLTKLTYQPHPLIDYVMEEPEQGRTDLGFNQIIRAPRDLYGVDQELNKTLDIPEVDEYGRMIPRPASDLHYTLVDEALDNSATVESLGEEPPIDMQAFMKAMAFYATYVTTE